MIITPKIVRFQKPKSQPNPLAVIVVSNTVLSFISSMLRMRAVSGSGQDSRVGGELIILPHVYPHCDSNEWDEYQEDRKYIVYICRSGGPVARIHCCHLFHPYREHMGQHDGCYDYPYDETDNLF